MCKALDRLRAGELDVVSGLYAEHVRDAGVDPQQVIAGSQPSCWFMGFQVRTPPFDDVRVRRALVDETFRVELDARAGCLRPAWIAGRAVERRLHRGRPHFARHVPRLRFSFLVGPDLRPNPRADQMPEGAELRRGKTAQLCGRQSPDLRSSQRLHLSCGQFAYYQSA